MQTLATFIIGLLATVPLYAYSSPGEIFPDLEIPAEQEQVSSSSVSTSSAVSQAEESSSVMSTEEASSDISSSAEPTSTGSPMFYRSGERVEPKQEPEPKEPKEPKNIFEEPKPAVPDESEEQPTTEESDPTDEESLQQEDEPADEQDEETDTQEQDTEEQARPAASESGSLLFRLLWQMKYALGALVLAVAGYFYWSMYGNKPSAPSAGKTPTQPNNSVPDATPTPMVEESSERLEHALNAIENPEPTTPPNEEK